ncbi:hypothetical protein FRC17_005636 [Serendipita sp. 399]|nr:hypothetical protein FRC17_005636 [Serendipita sp. 399]
MPSNGVDLSPSSDLLTTPEILRLARIFVQYGVDKIRLTGGEPTIRRDLLDIIRGFNELKEHQNGLKTIAMTSNGVVLSIGTKLRDIVGAGLTHLNLSLDTLDPNKFEVLTRRPSKMHAAVLSTLQKALELFSTGNEPTRLHSLKLNVVVMRGVNDDEVASFAALTRTMPICVRFIEFMPFQGNRWRKDTMIKSSELVERLKAIHPGLSPITSPSGDQTSREWKIPDHLGTLGFISSMSDHFCASCTRLRLTADGQIKVCLFDPHEVSLRDLLRGGASDEEVMALVGRTLRGKKARHAGMDVIAMLSETEGADGIKKNRPMIKIGLSNLSSFADCQPYLQQPTEDRVPRPTSGLMNPIPSFSLVTDKSKQLTLPMIWPRRISLGPYRTAPRVVSRTYSLTHLDESGSPRMVDVSEKGPTIRKATATGMIYINKTAYSLITSQEPGVEKEQFDALEKARTKAGGSGKNVLTIAQLAGIIGAKHTSQIIPLCHPLPISSIDVSLNPVEETAGEAVRWAILCEATVKTEGKTGVEMEALMGVSTALLTVWDMLKSIAGQEMTIGGIKVVSKEGGKSSFVRTHVSTT